MKNNSATSPSQAEICQIVGIDDASPFVDVRLQDGTRFHAVLAPVARPGTVLSLRVPARRAFTLEQLLARGTVTAAGARLLRDLVASRKAFLVTGGTGGGKTTLLAGLLGLVDQHERLVIVEDASELRPDHPHVVGLEGRPANVEGAGEITVRDLVRQALRMRPDRLIVGEVRGADAPRSSVSHPDRCVSVWLMASPRNRNVERRCGRSSVASSGVKVSRRTVGVDHPYVRLPVGAAVRGPVDVKGGQALGEHVITGLRERHPSPRLPFAHRPCDP